MKKIKIISPDLSSNCMGRSIVLYNLLKEEYDVEILGIATKGYIWNNSNNLYVTKKFKGRALLSFLKNYKYNKKLLEKEKVKAFIISKPLLSSLGYFLILNKDKKIKNIILDIDDYELGLFRDLPFLKNLILTAINILGPNNYLTTLLMEKFIKNIKKIVFSSEVLIEKYRISSDKVVVIPHIKTPDFYESCKDFSKYENLLKKLIKKDNEFIIGFIGTPRKHKGIYYILKNIKKMHIKGKKVKFLIAGGKVKIPKNVEDRIINIEQFPFCLLEKMYNFIDVLILLQIDKYEGASFQTPSKLFDAIYFNTPVIATSNRIFKEYINEKFLLKSLSLIELNKKLNEINNSLFKKEKLFKVSYNELLTKSKYLLKQLIEDEN